MPRQQIYDMPFGKVYDCLIAKAERKGRTRDEVDELTRWLTGYDNDDITAAYIDNYTYGDFFRKMPRLNPNAELIKGSICGVKIEEIEDMVGNYEEKAIKSDILVKKAIDFVVENAKEKK